MRLILLATVLFCAAPFGVAEEKAAKDPRIEEMLKKMPSDAELEKAAEAMPDMNALMGAMMKAAQDPDTRASMERMTDRLEGAIDKDAFKSADGELPDFNAMLTAMMKLAGDREMMADMLGVGLAMQDEIQAAAPEAKLAPKATPDAVKTPK